MALIYDRSWLASATTASRPSALFNCFLGRGRIARAFKNEFRQCSADTNHRAINYVQLQPTIYCNNVNHQAVNSTKRCFLIQRGKAAGLDGITAEHLQYNHPLLPCALAKLFNFLIKQGYVPHSFRESYTVPILKDGISSHGKSVTVDDFRGITISPALSKVLEHCLLTRHEKLFKTSDNQFGF